MKKYLILFVALGACHATNTEVEVKVAGNLRAIMLAGDYRPTIDLRTLSNEPNFYALGAAAELDGEILVMNSKPFLTKVENDTFTMNRNWEAEAALLVYAQVPDWTTSQVQDELTMDELADLLAEKAANNKPVPFIIRGVAVELNWHIVNGRSGVEHAHSNHAASGYQGKANLREVEILGFYSRHHEGVFTHKGQFTHVHFKTVDGSMSGHVDQVRMSAGSSLSIPKTL